MKRDEPKQRDYGASVEGEISGCNNHIGGHQETNYNGMARDDLINMLEERFHHILWKESQLNALLEENKKGNGMISQLIEDNRRLVERINYLTDRLLN